MVEARLVMESSLIFNLDECNCYVPSNPHYKKEKKKEKKAEAGNDLSNVAP